MGDGGVGVQRREITKMCPYCGMKPIVMRLGESEWSVHCKRCWNGSGVYDTRDEAIDAYLAGDD